MGSSSSFLLPDMELFIYEDRCLTCGDSQRFDTIYFMAKKYGLKIVRRRVYVLPELRAEADSFRTPMPFIAIGDKTLDFYAIGEYMLKDEVLEQFINEAKNEQGTT